MKEKLIYRINFVNQSEVYEIFARQIDHNSLIGFIAASELIFGERTSVLVDPSEEKLKNEFDKVQTTYIPIHSIVRIDVVEKEGVAKVIGESQQGNIRQFPIYSQPPDKRE